MATGRLVTTNMPTIVGPAQRAGRSGFAPKGSPGPSAAEEISQDEEYVGRPLRQPPHIVGIPGAPERHVQPHPPAVGDQFALQVPADAVQHLELEGLARDLALAGEAFGPL